MKLRLTHALSIFVALSALLVACSSSNNSSPAVTSPPGGSTQSTGGSNTGTVGPTVTPAPTATSATEPVISAQNFQSLHAVSTATLQNAQFLAWQTDSNKLLVASRSQAVLLTRGSNTTQSVYTAPGNERIVAVSITGLIASSSDQSSIDLHTINGASLGSIQVGSAFGSVAFSPDGSTLAIGRMDKIAVDIWDVKQLQMTKELTGFNTAAPVYSASFAPDGKAIIWLSRATVQLQDIASGQMGARFEHQDFASGLALTSNLKLVTASGQIATIWNAQTGAKITELQLDGIASDVELLLNNQYAAIATGTGLSLWDLNSQQPAGHAQLMARQMTLSPGGGMLGVIDANGDASIVVP